MLSVAFDVTRRPLPPTRVRSHAARLPRAEAPRGRVHATRAARPNAAADCAGTRGLPPARECRRPMDRRTAFCRHRRAIHAADPHRTRAGPWGAKTVGRAEPRLAIGFAG